MKRVSAKVRWLTVAAEVCETFASQQGGKADRAFTECRDNDFRAHRAQRHAAQAIAKQIRDAMTDDLILVTTECARRARGVL